MILQCLCGGRELEPVFEAMLANAVRICGAQFGTLHRFDGTMFEMAAGYGTPPAMVEFQRQRGPFLPAPGNSFDRMLRTRQVCHVADAQAIAEELGVAGDPHIGLIDIEKALAVVSLPEPPTTRPARSGRRER